MKILIIIIFPVFFAGCIKYLEMTQKMQNFQYEYKMDGKSKKQIWKLARNHYATVYGDFRSVFSVQDEEEGTLIGKGTIKWTFDHGMLNCYRGYHIKFHTKNEYAKLTLKLMRTGRLSCKLTENGYKQMQEHLINLHNDLNTALIE